MQETWVRFLGQEDGLEKKMAIYSSILAWRISRTEEPGRLHGVARIGVGCHSLLQRIFLTQESNPGFLHCRQILYQLNHQCLINPVFIILLHLLSSRHTLQSCLTVCDPIDGSPPGSPVPGTLPARVLEWIAISFFQCMKVKSESEVSQSCPTLSDPVDCSPQGSSIHGIFQPRVLE